MLLNCTEFPPRPIRKQASFRGPVFNPNTASPPDSVSTTNT